MVRKLVLIACLAALAAPAAAAPRERPVCLTAAEQRAAIAQGKAISLAQAVRTIRGSVRARGSREVVKARLCRRPAGGLVYVLTVLARDGKVTRTTVDANSGRIVEAR